MENTKELYRSVTIEMVEDGDLSIENVEQMHKGIVHRCKTDPSQSDRRDGLAAALEDLKTKKNI